jgi:hypothetical protein
LAAIALMLDEGEKNASLSDTKRLCGFTSVSETKSEGEYWTLYKELADDEMNLSVF